MTASPTPTNSRRPPSGEQVELAYGEHRAVVVEVGGGLRQYAFAGNPVIDGYEQNERCRSGRGQILAPWPNRLRDGTYEWMGSRHQLALSEARLHNAIHGLVRWANWTVAERTDARVVMAHTLHPQDGYPFALALRVAYALGPEGIVVETTARNVGPDACPYGVGAHPYLTVGDDPIDGWTLHVRAGGCLQTDERSIPVGSFPVDGTEYDFRLPREIGTTRLDSCLCELARDPGGIATVVLEGSRRVSLWLDEHHPYLMLFTGDTLSDETRRRRSVAVEPMTCAPNAFQSGAGLRTLEPGEAFTSRWGIRPE